MRELKPLAVLASGLVVCCGNALALDDAERERLTVISNELQQLQQLVATTGQQFPQTDRVKFRYDILVTDLKLVQQGVNDHLDAPRQPRPITPIKGDYRR